MSIVTHTTLRLKGEEEALNTNQYCSFVITPDDSDPAARFHFDLCQRICSYNTIQRVEYVVNPKIMKEFFGYRDHLKKLNADTEISYMFHGTCEDNIQSIVRNHFDMKLCGTNTGSLYGKGIYLSPNLKKASDYSDDEKVILALTMPGNIISVAAKTHLDLLEGYDTHRCCDSVNYCFFDTKRLLPCYILHFW